MKILRLDLAMERIRVDLKTREELGQENHENPLQHTQLDVSYLRLLERYKRADSVPVKYTAEFESARLTKNPNLVLWIDALAQQAGTPIQGMAVQVLGDFLVPRFMAEGRQLAGAERAELVSAALKPEAVDARLLPAPLPLPENIRNARQWSRFALVDVRQGSPPRDQSFYSMLFERRGNRWVFLCPVATWIS
jgi:hypothetical protein